CDETNLMPRNGPGDDFGKLLAILRSGKGCPPLSWPLSVGPPTSAGDLAAKNVAMWNRPELSDYGSVYHQLYDYRGAYPVNVLSLPQVRAQMERAIGLLPSDRPRGVLIPFAGDYYRKRVPGDHYRKGDELIIGPHRP